LRPSAKQSNIPLAEQLNFFSRISAANDGGGGSMRIKKNERNRKTLARLAMMISQFHVIRICFYFEDTFFLTLLLLLLHFWIKKLCTTKHFKLSQNHQQINALFQSSSSLKLSFLQMKGSLSFDKLRTHLKSGEVKALSNSKLQGELCELTELRNVAPFLP